MRRSSRNCAWRTASLLALSIALHLHASDGALFPSPLHLTRRIEDPISGRAEIVEEYYFANRAVSAANGRVAIADFENDHMTVIDARRGTYSVAPFRDVAATSVLKSDVKWELAPAEARRVNERDVDVIEAQSAVASMTVALDRAVFVSPAAFDVVTGSAWPGLPGPGASAFAAIVGQTKREGRGDLLPLPIEQSFSYSASGETLRFRNVVIRVGHEHAPADLIAIPPGARLVEPDEVTREQILRRLGQVEETP